MTWTKCRAPDSLRWFTKLDEFASGVLYYSQKDRYCYFSDYQLNWYKSDNIISIPGETI